MNTKAVNFLKFHYSAIHGTYWLMLTITGAFVTPILIDKGFSDSQIGIISAFRNVTTIVVQIFLAGFADRHSDKIKLKYIMSAVLGMGLLATIVFDVFPINFWSAMIIFGIFGATISCVSPMLDSLAIAYNSTGIPINFAASRSVGSGAWAFGCVILGMFADFAGVQSLITVQIFLIAIVIFVIVTIKSPGKLPQAQGDGQRQSSPVSTTWNLLKTHKKFTVFLIASALCMGSHCLAFTFLIEKVKSVGGNNADFGIQQFVLALCEIPAAIAFVWIRKKISLEKVMLIYTIMQAIQVLGIFMSASVGQMLLAQIFEGGYGLYYSCTVLFVMKHLPLTDMVKGTGLISVANGGVGAGLGVLLGGVIKQSYGLNTLLLISVFVGIAGIAVMFISGRMKYTT